MPHEDRSDFSLPGPKKQGFNIRELLAAGVTINELLAAGYQKKEIDAALNTRNNNGKLASRK